MNKKIKRLLLGVLISVLLLGTSAGISTIAAKTAKVEVDKKGPLYKALTEEGFFDPVYYANTNPDVIEVLGGTYESLLRHFIVYGIFEGRQPNSYFNVNAYSSAYGDLRKAFITPGKSKEQLIIDYYNHYVTYGQKENRLYCSLDRFVNDGGRVIPVSTSIEEYSIGEGTLMPGTQPSAGSGAENETTTPPTEGGNNEQTPNPNANNGVDNSIANSQHMSIGIKEGLEINCPHNSTYYELVVSQAGPNNNGYVGKVCDLCKNRFEGYNIHAYKTYQYFDNEGKSVDITGWVVSEYDGTTNSQCGGTSLSIINKINQMRDKAGKKNLTWAASSQASSNERAIEIAVVPGDTKPIGKPWNQGTDFKYEIQFSGIANVDAVWNNIMADDAKKALLLQEDITAISVACFHHFTFSNGSNIPIEGVYWVIELK